MNLLKRKRAGLQKPGVKARAYRRLQYSRAALLSIMLVTVATVLVNILTTPNDPPLSRPGNWRDTRTFSALNDPAELVRIIRASYAAHQFYVLKADVSESLAALDRNFDNVRSEAELRAALLQHFAATKDRFAELFDATNYDTRTAMLNRDRIGVGLEFAFDEDSVEPVLRATLKEGEIQANSGLNNKDVVLRIDGTDVTSVPTFQSKEEGTAAEVLTQYVNTGRLGSTVKLQVAREGALLDVVLTRHVVQEGEPFRVSGMGDPATGQGVPDGRVIEFFTLNKQNTAAKLAETLEGFKKSGVRGIILDLTGVNGGDPNVAIQVAALFIDTGVISHRIEVSSGGDLEMLTWEAKDGGVLLRRKGPFKLSSVGNLLTTEAVETHVALPDWKSGIWTGDAVTAISDSTVGAGEVVAAALKPQVRRGQIVGLTSGGKGMSQSHFNIGGSTILGVTTGYYLKPDGSSIQDQGVVPDVMVNGQSVATHAQFVMAQRLKLIPMPKYPDIIK